MEYVFCLQFTCWYVCNNEPYNFFNYVDNINWFHYFCKGLRLCTKWYNVTRIGTKSPALLIRLINYYFSGVTNGELLPPYIVYKGFQPLIQWTQNGPPNARYAASKSGWFDQNLFENWFDIVLYLVLKRLTGKKLVICDNLTSHISLHVLSQCDKIMLNSYVYLLTAHIYYNPLMCLSSVHWKHNGGTFFVCGIKQRREENMQLFLNQCFLSCWRNCLRIQQSIWPRIFGLVSGKLESVL